MPRFTYKTVDGETLTINTEIPLERTSLIQQGWVEETSEELEAKTAAELKEEAKAAGLPTTGTKAEIAKRLAEGVPSEGDEAPAKS